MVKEARHAVEYRFPLIDLDTTERVDAMSDESVRPVVNHLMRQLDQEVRRVMVQTVSLKRERLFELASIEYMPTAATVPFGVTAMRASLASARFFPDPAWTMPASASSRWVSNIPSVPASRV